MTPQTGDFYEDDEPIEKIMAEWNAAEKGLTARPADGDVWIDSDSYTWDGHGNAWHRYSTPDDEGEWQPAEMVPGVPDWVLSMPDLVLVERPWSRWQRFRLWLHVRRNGGQP